LETKRKEYSLVAATNGYLNIGGEGFSGNEGVKLVEGYYWLHQDQVGGACSGNLPGRGGHRLSAGSIYRVSVWPWVSPLRGTWGRIDGRLLYLSRRGSL